MDSYPIGETRSVWAFCPYRSKVWEINSMPDKALNQSLKGIIGRRPVSRTRLSDKTNVPGIK